MLHSNHLGIEVSESHFSGSSTSSTGRQGRAAQDLSDLEAVLAKELSPNKRAIIETLISAWSSNSQIYSKQTG